MSLVEYIQNSAYLFEISFTIFFSPQGVGKRRDPRSEVNVCKLKIHPSSLENLNQVLKRFVNTLGFIISKGNTVAIRFIVKVSNIDVLNNVALILGNAR